MSQQIEAVVIVAGVPDTRGNILSAEAVQKMADGVRLFFDAQRQALVYRGPADGLPYEPAVKHLPTSSPTEPR